MTEEKGYNGYTNYETWLLCLNIDNEEGLYNEIRDLVELHSEEEDLFLGDMIKEYLAELFYNEEFQVYKICDTWTERDWQEIDWEEVAETRREE